jgi:hypothetical protein
MTNARHKPLYRKETTMRNEQAAPETKGVTVKLLAALDLGPAIEGFTTIKTGRAWSTYCKVRSLIIEMEWLRSMGREWAGPRIRTPCTGLRIKERRRRWRSQSI